MSSSTFEIKTKAVRAGAGAGKTHNLTHQVLDFAIGFKQRQSRWPRVLVTTFTRKATQELSERLVKLALDEKPEALDFVSSNQFLGVSTIHGILDRFLKQWGHLIDLKSDFGYMKPNEAAHAAKKILKELSQDAATYTPLFLTFSFRQLRELLVHSLEVDLQDSSPVQKADLEGLLHFQLLDLQERLSDVLGRAENYDGGEKLSAIWSQASRILPGLDATKWELTREGVLAAISDIKLVGLRPKPDIKPIYEEFKDILEDLRKLQKPDYDPAIFASLGEINLKFEILRRDFKSRFEDFKKTSNKIEISDLETYAFEIVRRFPQAARAYSADTDYWLIDEFQDTSPQQLQILEFLIGEKPYYVVGDPQQSIYLFRGARSEVFRDKAAAIEKQGGTLQVLDTNYRSTPELLQFINTLSRSLGPQFQGMKAADKEHGDMPEAARFVVVTEQEDSDLQEALEMEALLNRITELRAQGTAFEQMAILVRKNSQLENLGAYLTAQGLPIHLHSSGLFWERREVQDAVALLKFFLNPYDDFNLIKLLRAPFFAVTDRHLADASVGRTGFPGGPRLWDALRRPMADGAYGLGSQRLVEHLKNAQKLGIVVGFQRALESVGFFDLHLHYDPTGRAEGNLWKFVHLLKAFEKERGANLHRFVNEAERPERMDRTVDAPGSVEPNKINIMTVHAAKGLQFDYVFLPFLGKKPYKDKMLKFPVDEAGKKWSVRAPASENETSTTGSLFEKKVIADFDERLSEEDLRLFYVAYTRAKKQIYFSWSAPAKAGSWAERLAGFVTTSGRIEEEGFTRIVEVMETSRGVPPGLLRAGNQKRIEPYQDRREHSWGASIKSGDQTVTGLVEAAKPVRVRNYKNAFIKKTQGILFHKLLEIIKYPTQKDIAGLVSEWFPGDEEDVGDALNYALALQEPPLIELIKTGQVEWSFRTQKDKTHGEIQGQIDLWGISGEVLWLVDYKSGEKILKDKAFQQLRVYASALRDHLGWNGTIQLAVVYPFVQETHLELMKPEDFIF